MTVWFVSAAWRRYDVTRLALAQRAHLCGELAARGIDATCVIVADDDNLEIAAGYGFETVEQNNDYLGRKFNDGIEFACHQGADYVVLIGSDDWMHADLFDRLPLAVAEPPAPTDEHPFVLWSECPEALTGREIALVNLEAGVIQRCRVRGTYGVIPWVFPRAALEPAAFRPASDKVKKGLDGSLVAGLGVRPEWVFTDPHDVCRVDFKSRTNLNSYAQITSAIGYGDEEPAWPLLAERYPQHLVDMARSVSETMAVAA